MHLYQNLGIVGSGNLTTGLIVIGSSYQQNLRRVGKDILKELIIDINKRCDLSVGFQKKR